MTEPIDTSSLVDRVYEYLLDQIVSGVIKYGESISIKNIAAALNVSTMPVREAVKRLEYDQVLTVRPRSSCRVRVPSPRMIDEVYELREVLELYAVRKSAGRVEPEALARLHRIVDRMYALSRSGDESLQEKEAAELDREFHFELCALAKNDFLNHFYRQLSLHANMTLIHEKTYHLLQGDWPDVHAHILDCLEKDPDTALEALQHHFSNVTNLLTRTKPD